MRGEKGNTIETTKLTFSFKMGINTMTATKYENIAAKTTKTTKTQKIALTRRKQKARTNNRKIHQPIDQPQLSKEYSTITLFYISLFVSDQGWMGQFRQPRGKSDNPIGHIRQCGIYIVGVRIVRSHLYGDVW